jgi:hypothetical protein
MADARIAAAEDKAPGTAIDHRFVRGETKGFEDMASLDRPVYRAKCAVRGRDRTGLAKATLPGNPNLKWDAWSGVYGVVRDPIAQGFPDLAYNGNPLEIVQSTPAPHVKTLPATLSRN